MTILIGAEIGSVAGFARLDILCTMAGDPTGLQMGSRFGLVGSGGGRGCCTAGLIPARAAG
jgi:hypothetical protein